MPWLRDGTLTFCFFSSFFNPGFCRGDDGVLQLVLCSDRTAGSSWWYHVQSQMLWAKKSSVGTTSDAPSVSLLVGHAQEAQGVHLGGEAALKNKSVCFQIPSLVQGCTWITANMPQRDKGLMNCPSPVAPQGQGTCGRCWFLHELIPTLARHMNSPECVWIGWVLENGKYYILENILEPNKVVGGW